MSNTAAAQPVPKTTAEYETEFEQMMAEADTLNEHMHRDRADIERLKAETSIIRNETRALLASMGVKI